MPLTTKAQTVAGTREISFLVLPIAQELLREPSSHKESKVQSSSLPQWPRIAQTRSVLNSPPLPQSNNSIHPASLPTRDLLSKFRTARSLHPLRRLESRCPQHDQHPRYGVGQIWHPRQQRIARPCQDRHDLLGAPAAGLGATTEILRWIPTTG
jgi:hypothetical protein